MKGTVKWYNIRKGYGFISGEDGNDYFVHYTAVPKGVFLRENDSVEFEPADTDKGKQAQNVQLTQKASDKGEAPTEQTEQPQESNSEEQQ